MQRGKIWATRQGRCSTWGSKDRGKYREGTCIRKLCHWETSKFIPTVQRTMVGFPLRRSWQAPYLLPPASQYTLPLRSQHTLLGPWPWASCPGPFQAWHRGANPCSAAGKSCQDVTNNYGIRGQGDQHPAGSDQPCALLTELRSGLQRACMMHCRYFTNTSAELRCKRQLLVRAVAERQSGLARRGPFQLAQPG